MRSEVEMMKDVAVMIRNYFDGILSSITTRQTNGFLEAINGLFQAAKRKARGYGRFRTIRTLIFPYRRETPLLPHPQTTQNSTEASLMGSGSWSGAAVPYAKTKLCVR